MSVSRLASLLVVAVFAAGPLRAGVPGPNVIGLADEVPAHIEVRPVAERWSGQGFMPLRVRIENRGNERLRWDFSFTAGLGYGGDSLRRELALSAESREVAETVVFLPGAGVAPSGQRTTVSVMPAGPGALGRAAYMLHGNTGAPVVATATTAATEGALFSATHGSAGPTTEITVVEAALWPADWRVWSPFQRVVLGDQEFERMDGARRAALREWVAMGGVLDLYAAKGSGKTRQERHGLGVIRVNGRTLAEEAADPAKPLISLPTRDIAELRRVRGVEVSPERRDSLRLDSGALGIALFLLAFGIVVGPVNLFVFAPSGRRHRLFFTVPAISLGASVLLAGYIVVKDGFGGEGARTGVVLLLPEENQAVVTQFQISRTGVLLGSTFDLADDVVMEQEGTNIEFGYAKAGRPDSYERTGGRAGGDWFASRRVQEQTLRRLTPTRARVELVAGGENGAPPVVQSSVGAVLRDFRYIDEAGRAWGAEEVGPGEKAPLSPRPKAGVSHLEHRGSFSARGGAAEGLTPIPTLTSIRWDEPEFLYVGPLVGARKP